jgi:hypothetical protein
LRHQDRAERTLRHGEADVLALAAGAVVAGRHAEHRAGFGVEAGVGLVARVVHRRRDGRGALQSVAHALRAVRDRVVLRREAGDALEDSMEMERAQRGVARQVVERGQGLVGFDASAGGRDQRRVFLRECGAVRAAALAGAESRGLRGSAVVMEAHILRPRPPRGTGGLAVDAGAGDRVHEAAVGRGIARQHGDPARIAFGMAGKGVTGGHGAVPC